MSTRVLRSRTPQTPGTAIRQSVRLQSSVKRNLYTSFEYTDEEDLQHSPPKQLRFPTPEKTKDLIKNFSDLTLVIDKRNLTCRKKCFDDEEVLETLEKTPLGNQILVEASVQILPQTYVKLSPIDTATVRGHNRSRVPEKHDEGLPKRQVKSPKKLENFVRTPLRNKVLAAASVKSAPQVDLRSFPEEPLSKNRSLDKQEEQLPKRQVKTPKILEHYEQSPVRNKVQFDVNGKSSPQVVVKLFRDGTITPKVQRRSRVLDKQDTPLQRVRNELHVSYIPQTLPCRSKEYSDIYGFLQGKLFDKCGGCVYISGVPGTGKTATVTSIMNNLLKEAKLGVVPDFQYANINGMKLTQPRQAYVEILKQLDNKTVPWEQAQNILEEKFTKKAKKMKLPIILVVDELDIICTKRQDVIYNILDWPTKPYTQLIVLTIANTMDLPERLLMNRITSRLGLTRLTFQPYTYKQLQEIITKRLTESSSFNSDAIQLVARKVASVSGDARRALDICRRAAEIAELEGDDTEVTMNHVNGAIKAMITQPKVRLIKTCSRLEQLILQAIISEVERTGVEETIFSDVFRMLNSLSAINGVPCVSATTALKAVARLGCSRLLLVDQKGNDLDQKIILNVSSDDVYYALKEE